MRTRFFGDWKQVVLECFEHLEKEKPLRKGSEGEGTDCDDIAFFTATVRFQHTI
jgi:hypothetical protein